MTVERTREVAGVRVPTFVYGTAWKEERTEAAVTLALEAGFRGIDTANQRKHYVEEGVGRALARAFGEKRMKREDLFVQTKFTFRGGQDHRLPYDPGARVATQVAQSFESSLAHLGIDIIDSYVLHGPAQRRGLGAADLEAWRAMERLCEQGRARLLGISNVAPDQLEALLRVARVRPAFVQNRCYAELGWDATVRTICAREGIVYQGFSLLTANDRFLREGPIAAIARRLGRTPAQVVFRFALEVGAIPLTGTTDRRHMDEDLAVYDFALEREDLRAIERAGAG